MMADDEAALLEKMGIDSAYVIGWSDGGIIALELAIRHPDKVIKLASTGADICPDSTGKAVVSSYWENSKDNYAKNKDKKRLTADEKNRWKISMLDWRQPDIPLSKLQTIPCPSLIIGGDHDLIKIEHTTLIFQNIPHAYLWILPHSGHGTLIEHTDEFNKTVDDFFKTPYRL
jgi:Predicted hydrolases or acyltransferases (alpha/beta hydrolase superfamily)